MRGGSDQWKFHERGDRPLVTGPVTLASVIIYRGTEIVDLFELSRAYRPARTNSGSAWLSYAHKMAGRNGVGFFIDWGRSVNASRRVMVINNGDGVLSGRGNTQNLVEFIILDDEGLTSWKLALTITHQHHNQKYLAKKARGEPIRKNRDFSKLTYIDPNYNQVMRYMPEDGNHLAYTLEEYFAEFPHHKGQIPVRGHPNIVAKWEREQEKEKGNNG